MQKIEKLVIPVYYSAPTLYNADPGSVYFYVGSPTKFFRFDPDGNFGYQGSISGDLAVWRPDVLARMGEGIQARSEVEMQKVVARLLGRGGCSIAFVRGNRDGSFQI